MKKQVEGGWDCTVVAADKIAVVVVADIAVVLALAVEV